METGEAASFERKLRFLNSHGTREVPHSGRKLLGHLLGTFALLRVWGARPAVCDAGLFHSVYGTENYKQTTIAAALRTAVQEVIGLEAERLAFLFGMKTGSSFAEAVLLEANQ